jgi:hypothetical protein
MCATENSHQPATIKESVPMRKSLTNMKQDIWVVLSYMNMQIKSITIFNKPIHHLVENSSLSILSFSCKVRPGGELGTHFGCVEINFLTWHFL